MWQSFNEHIVHIDDDDGRSILIWRVLRLNLSTLAVIQIAIITMQNFFTPIEVVRSHVLPYSNEELLRFNEALLFQITQPRVPSLADERKKVIHWLRSIPVAHRQQAAALHSPEFAALCRRLYQQDESSTEPMRYRFQQSGEEFRILRGRYYKHSRERQKALLEDVRLISHGQLFQALTLAESALTDPQQLFERFELVLGGVLLDGNHFSEDELKSGRVSFSAQAQGSEFKTLGFWVAELILKQILLSFTTGSAKIEEACKHSKQQQQEYSKLWRDLPPADRFRLAQKGFSKPIQELMEQYRNSVQVAVQQLPKLYIIQTIEEAIKEYAEINSKDIYNRVVFSTLEQSLNLYEIFKIELAMEIEAELTGQKATAKKQKKKKKKNTEQVDRIPPTTSAIAKKETQILPSPRKVEKVSVHQMEVNAKNSQMQISTQPDHQQAQSKITSTEQNSKQTPPQPQKQTLSILDDFTRRLKQKNRDKYRKIILNRITVILSQLNVACRPFGSYAVHLSLPDSDLDLQVDSSLLGYFYLQYLPQRKQVVVALDFIKRILEPHPWAKDFELLHNARIPLLTFKADAGVHFPNQAVIKTKLRLNGKPVPNGQAAIQVDLSIQPYTNMTEIPHNGLEATQLIREWVQSMPNLQKLVLGLKTIIRKANLHKSYEGGLSSYCLVLLAVAFLKSTPHEDMNSDDLLESLVKFIGRFHQQRLVVDIAAEQIVRKSQAQISVLISPWDGRNLVQRVFRFEEILAAIKIWKEALQK